MRALRCAALVGATLLAAAAPASAIRFTAIGDWGAGSSGQARVATQVCADHARAKAAFIATVGDNFYDTGTARPDTFQTPMRCVINLRLPWRAAWGNHDVPGPSTRTVLGATRRWYSFTPGGVARVIMLDSNQVSSDTQLAFLRQVLRSEVGKSRPIIVMFHHPPRTAGTHPPDLNIRRRWEPLFLQYKVRLVLQGHNHNYERIHYKGLTYITTGGGGARLYPCIREQTGLRVCKSTHQFVSVTATPAKLTVRAVDDKGRVIDFIRLRPKF